MSNIPVNVVQVSTNFSANGVSYIIEERFIPVHQSTWQSGGPMTMRHLNIPWSSPSATNTSQR